MNYTDQESCMIDYKGELVPPTTIKQSLLESRVIAGTIINDEDRIDHDWEVSMIVSVESSSNPRLLSEKVLSHYKGTYTFFIKKLTDLRNISLEMAKRTTSQLCLRSNDIPSLSRRYITNDRMLRYSRISCNIFTDTLFANKEKCTSTRRNIAASSSYPSLISLMEHQWKVVHDCVALTRNSLKRLECLPVWYVIQHQIRSRVRLENFAVYDPVQ